MPELPEVETVRRGLIKKVKGKKILNATVLWNNIIAYPKKEEFIKNIANQTIKGVKEKSELK